jgi:hypothetical protein
MAGLAALARRAARPGAHLLHRRLHLSPGLSSLPGTEKRTPGGIVNGSRSACPSSPRTFFPLLILIALLLVLVAAATPASAYENWEHGGARERTCDSSGCHRDQTPGNTACVGCHSGYTTSSSKKCWDCHEPGTSPASDCAAACHLNQGGSDNYSTSFTHGQSPHLGASGYGKTCANCHGAGNPHHAAAAGHQPTCAECHNGTTAKLPPSSHNDGKHTNCATCHVGMSKPITDCAACHVGNPGSGGPQIAYSNSPACGDAACHGKIANHAGTPITAAPCITCHTEHYATLGTCTKCHTDPQSFHHATATPRPLSDCAGCHNGTIAATPPNHASYGTSCAVCHTGMNKPPSDCLACHDKPQGGVPAVVYTTDLTCGDARCHTMVPSHSGTPIKNVACTTCHTAHYEDLGTCATCHPDSPSFHHGTATATPLADCAGCHHGAIASAKRSHDGQACVACHEGMTQPPVPATCQTCHAAERFGAVTCTDCHSETGLIGKETAHAPDPGATVSCTTCHKSHYRDLGTCDSCHGSHAETHHGTATLADTQLTLVARPSAVRAHRKATLKGSLRAAGRALAAQKVLVEARTLKGGTFKKVAVVKTGADGRFSRVVKPRVGTEYRAVWRPAGAYVVLQRPAVDTVKLRVRK